LKNTKEKNKKISTTTMAVVALMTAVLCVLAPFSIPVGPIPISLATLGLYLAVIILGRKRAVTVCLLYLLIGFIGLPVYSGFSGGPAKLLGPTGGYLIGYVFLTYIAGIIVDKFPKNHWLCLLGLVIGTVVCYIWGTGWMAYQMKLAFVEAIMIGVVPFLVGDVIKIATAVWIGQMIKKQIRVMLN